MMKTFLLACAACVALAPVTGVAAGQYGSMHPVPTAVFAQTDTPHENSSQGDPQRWVQLGCRYVNLAVGRDEILVSDKNSRVSAIRVKVTGNDVEMLDVKVIYDSDDIPVRSVIHAGYETDALDLTATRRIDRIELIYKTVANFQGEAQVCVDGLRDSLATLPKRS